MATSASAIASFSGFGTTLAPSVFPSFTYTHGIRETAKRYLSGAVLGVKYYTQIRFIYRLC